MNDKELLEFSAKAYGCKGLDYRHGSDRFYYDDEDTGRECWNPVDDDGQTLRLSVKCDMQVNVNRVDGFVEVIAGYHGEHRVREMLHPDKFAATRLAVSRAAAEIGKSL